MDKKLLRQIPESDAHMRACYKYHLFYLLLQRFVILSYDKIAVESIKSRDVSPRSTHAQDHGGS